MCPSEGASVRSCTCRRLSSYSDEADVDADRGVDVLDQEQVRWESLSDEERRIEDESYGTTRANVGTTGPAVVSVSGVIASLAVSRVHSPRHRASASYSSPHLSRRSCTSDCVQRLATRRMLVLRPVESSTNRRLLRGASWLTASSGRQSAVERQLPESTAIGRGCPCVREAPLVRRPIRGPRVCTNGNMPSDQGICGGRGGSRTNRPDWCVVPDRLRFAL
jgi:hypothetical protein